MESAMEQSIDKVRGAEIAAASAEEPTRDGPIDYDFHRRRSAQLRSEMLQRVWPALVGAMRDLVWRIVRAIRIRRCRASLHATPDYVLKDLGISRSYVDHLAECLVDGRTDPTMAGWVNAHATAGQGAPSEAVAHGAARAPAAVPARRPVLVVGAATPLRNAPARSLSRTAAMLAATVAAGLATTVATSLGGLTMLAAKMIVVGGLAVGLQASMPDPAHADGSRPAIATAAADRGS
jgi:hypothetical protein